jgi:hypothetical protein
MHLFNRGKGAIDIVGHTLARNIDKRAKQRTAAPNFNV